MEESKAVGLETALPGRAGALSPNVGAVAPFPACHGASCSNLSSAMLLGDDPAQEPSSRYLLK